MRQILRVALAVLVQPNEIEQLGRLRGEFGQATARRPDVVTDFHRLDCDAHILRRRQLRENVGDLERFSNAHAGELVLAPDGDIASLEGDAPLAGWEGAGQDIEAVSYTHLRAHETRHDL